MSGEYPIKALCATLGVSRSGFYAWARATGSTYARGDRELRAIIAVAHRAIAGDLRQPADHD